MPRNRHHPTHIKPTLEQPKPGLTNEQKGAIGGSVGVVVLASIVVGILAALGYLGGSTSQTTVPVIIPVVKNNKTHSATHQSTSTHHHTHTATAQIGPSCTIDGALVPGSEVLFAIPTGTYINSTTDGFVRGPLYIPPTFYPIETTNGGWVWSAISSDGTYNDITFAGADGSFFLTSPLNTVAGIPVYVSSPNPRKTVPTVEVWDFVQYETSLYFCGLGKYPPNATPATPPLPGVGKINLQDVGRDNTFGYPAVSTGYMDLTGWTGTWNNAATSIVVDGPNGFLYVMAYNATQIGIAKLDLSGNPISAFGSLPGFAQVNVPLFSNTQTIANRAMCITPTNIVYFGTFGIPPNSAGGALVWGGLTTTDGSYDRTFAGNGQSVNYMDISNFNGSSYGATGLDAIYDPINNQIYLAGMVVTGISGTNVYVPFVLLLTGSGIPIASFGNTIYAGLYIYLPTTPLNLKQFSGAYFLNGTLYMCYSYNNALDSLEQTTLFVFNNTGLQKSLVLGTGTSSLTFTAFSAVPFIEGGVQVLLCVGNVGAGFNAVTPYAYQVCLL